MQITLFPHFRFSYFQLKEKRSFQIIKQLFPSLFKDIAVENFHCEVYELAKHKHVSFSINNERSPVPFSLIHSDI